MTLKQQVEMCVFFDSQLQIVERRILRTGLVGHFAKSRFDAIDWIFRAWLACPQARLHEAKVSRSWECAHQIAVKLDNLLLDYEELDPVISSRMERSKSRMELLADEFTDQLGLKRVLDIDNVDPRLGRISKRVQLLDRVEWIS